MNFKKIAIFGGTFNPIHKAHIHVAKTAIDQLELDQLFFVPNYINPFKHKSKAFIEPVHKINMINLVKISKSQVSDFEIKAQQVSYTIKTVNYFKHKYPNAKIYLIIGSDNLKNLHKWRDYKEILSKIQLVIFNRSHYLPKKQINKYNAIILEGQPIESSSTMIRNGNFSFLDEKVNEYIGKNQLYIEDILSSFVNNGERLKHCYNTAKFAAQIAAQHKEIDNHDAYLAGLLHDITKTWSEEKHRLFLKQQDYPEEKLLFYQLHQTSASLWLKNVYKLAKENIIEAIGCHTSLCENMSTLSKIVFVADKLAIGRKFEGVQKLRKLALENLDEAFKKLVQMSAEFHKDTINSEQQKRLYEIHSEK
ncbi:nicotinate-nucleotide adenylyltransferase [Mesomycoplasma conjunctivae]|uniref:Probable nicotinate-nucleotide adenylyltransferase n=1 Tax=Mesomycoplasma conjunctivae (strain ATCC 25834 / NCTC 10147 / HRC/581) TaxID=572263 RepID=C5J5P0_MESCH|nr:nicotinate-nucleotide adenylyltransferase [Mesomycoplasma conjunctivae]CAT04764.1 Uncharacterized protein MG240 homolog [Mesomycoplasma conjunctivae]VEU65789.1 nicotinate-nucleotide adenylyltransferase [Mesomycoplasma conjunctivae]